MKRVENYGLQDKGRERRTKVYRIKEKRGELRFTGSRKREKN